MAVRDKEADTFLLFYTPSVNTSGREFAGEWRGESWAEAVENFLSSKPPSANKKAREQWKEAEERTIVPVVEEVNPTDEIVQAIDDHGAGGMEPQQEAELEE